MWECTLCVSLSGCVWCVSGRVSRCAYLRISHGFELAPIFAQLKTHVHMRMSH